MVGRSPWGDSYDYGVLDSFLELVGEPGELLVCHYFFNPNEAEEECTSKRLVDHATITRIEIAKKIPDLIQLARAAEGKVVEAANEVAASIERAISEHMEG